MKRILSILTAMVCALTLQAQTTLSVSLKGLDDGTKLILTDGADYNYNAIATAELKKGKAEFSIEATEPHAYRLQTDNTFCTTVVALAPGEKATLSAKANLQPGDDDNKGRLTLSDVKVKGSATHDLFLTQMPDHEAMNKAYEDYHTKNKAVLDKASKLQRGSDEWKAMEQTEEWKAFAKDEKEFFDMVTRVNTSAISNNYSNWMSPYFMLTVYTYLTTDSNLPQYEAMTEEVKNSYYGKLVAEKVVPMSTDTPMPDFTFTDHSTGKQMSLYDICKQNKYVLIDFWASWCNPCRKEIPNFKAQYELYKDKGLQIVSISADTKEAAWLKALDEEKLEWPNDIDGNQGICKLYKVQFYPTVYLLDSNARVIVSNDEARGQNLRDKLAELFK